MNKFLQLSRRHFGSTTKRIVAPPMVYISGEEMTRYCMSLVLDKWINPNIDTKMWEYYDLSCINRDQTDDKVLDDAVSAGKRLGAIFKEPTVTPTQVQKEKLGLSKTYGSPNGAMRRGWNGITISRDTIHIKGVELGFKNQVLFERHAVGGEYGAGYGSVGKGTLTTIFSPEDRSAAKIIDHRHLDDEMNAVVAYHNPLDNVDDLAHHFFKRCLTAGVVPYIVTKKTVFKWQEGFWLKMEKVFNEHYVEQFKKAGLLDKCGGVLQHLISDAASMQIIRWTDGGFGMAAHNYDGDMLTDEIAQVHRSPGFLTSNLIGKNDDGTMIKQYEASHGTVADMWDAHLNGEETSLNPLGMVEALLGSMEHSATLSKYASAPTVLKWCARLRREIHRAMAQGYGTRDLCGDKGLTTEQFVDYIAKKISVDYEDTDSEDEEVVNLDDIDLNEIFNFMDGDGDGQISREEFVDAVKNLKLTRVISQNFYDLHKRDPNKIKSFTLKD